MAYPQQNVATYLWGFLGRDRHNNTKLVWSILSVLFLNGSPACIREDNSSELGGQSHHLLIEHNCELHQVRKNQLSRSAHCVCVCVCLSVCLSEGVFLIGERVCVCLKVSRPMCVCLSESVRLIGEHLCVSVCVAQQCPTLCNHILFTLCACPTFCGPAGLQVSA